MPRRRDAAERVVVTGMGCVSPLGLDVESTVSSAMAGLSGISEITRFDASALGSRMAGQVEGDPDVPGVEPKELRRFDRAVRLALAAAHQATRQAGLDAGGVPPERIGVAVGSGIGGLGTLVGNQTVLDTKGPRRVSPFMIPMSIASMPSGMISLTHGFKGPSFAHVSACATGAHAIGESAETIRRGAADVMVVGGTEAAVLPLGVAGFSAMKALSTRNDAPERASRPFDTDRDGFVIGEGAGVLVLERLSDARARGAQPLAEVVGYGATSDASHMVAPDPEGEGAARCMQVALDDAGLEAQDIGHLNAHATSTPAGDPAEVRALRRVFGGALDHLPVSATKSMTGHLLGAAGALEAILTIEAMRAQSLPPTINLDTVDPECVLDHVRGKARSARPVFALSNSFGFGGTNGVLILGIDDL